MAKIKNKLIEPIGRFIDPLTDFGFKKIFGSEPNKDLLIAFLNGLFKGRKIIKDLTYSPQEQKGPAKYYRTSIFDLNCIGVDEEIFIVEMQKADQKFFTDRSVFYASSKIYDQGPKGRKGWDFKLKEVYFIALIDFSFDNSVPGKYLHRVRLAEEESGRTFYNKLGFIFLELPNFNIAEKDIKTDLERWLYVLRNMNKFDKIPVFLHKKIFQKLFKVAEVANLKKEEYMLYEKDLLDKWTEYSVLKTAEEKGIKKGIEQGIEQGIEKGVKRGKEEKSFEVVENLITELGLSDQQAARIAEVPQAFVKRVRATLRKKSRTP